MTKIVQIVLTEYQSEVYNTESRIVIPTGAAGVGSSCGLIYKALKEANEGKIVTFIAGSGSAISRPGGVFDQAIKVSTPFNPRVSRTSNIISVGDGKVKFIGNDADLDLFKGSSDDLVIFDHIWNHEILTYKLMRAKQIIIGMHFYRIMESKPEDWLQKLGIVECDESGKPVRFSDFVHHISCNVDNGFKFPGYEDYRNKLDSSESYDLKKLTMSTFSEWKF